MNGTVRPPRVALAPVSFLILALVLGPKAAQAGPGPGSAGLLAGAGPGVSAAAPDPWRVLDATRRSLAAVGAEQADFLQTYVPAGFSSGEEEVGRVALRLPDCLRWDYEEPFPKSFLICGDEVWSWNPEDRRGRTGSVERESQPGLDLLLLPVEELSERYDAEPVASEGERLTIELTPSSGSEGATAGAAELTEATLVVDRATERLVELSYRDLEGNRTTFELSAYRPLEEEDLFEPPAGIDWEGM